MFTEGNSLCLNRRAGKRPQSLNPNHNRNRCRRRKIPTRPTQEELQSANAARHYQLLPGAIMGLTIDSMGIYNAPVFDSASRWALAKGVAHIQRLPCHGHRPQGL